jgi:hypothetical protein
MMPNTTMGDAEDRDDVAVISPYEIRLEERKKWVKRTRRSFLALGVVAGATGAVIAYAISSSWPLAAFMFGLAAYVVGRGVGQAVTAEVKLERVLYFAVAPLTGIGALALARVAWEGWWPAVLIGTAGALAGGRVSKRLFPRVAWQVRRESRELGLLPDW